MKTYLLAAFLSLPALSVAQSSASSTAGLARQLNQLLHDPQEPEMEVRVLLTDCHFTQLIRRYRTRPAEGTTSIQVSHEKNGADWAVKSDDKVEFELKLGSDWEQITSLTYAPATHEKTGQRYYELKIRRERKENGRSANATFELPLHTTDEAVVRDLVSRLNQVRRNCGG